MKTGILINARMGSKRLKDKHFMKINNTPCIAWLLKRLINEFSFEIKKGKIELFLATGSKSLNSKFEDVKNYSKVFYGSDFNIPQRHFELANQYELTNIICIDGDDILCSMKAARDVLEQLNNNKFFIKTIGLPIGMNVIAYSSEFLKKCLFKKNYKILETGWPRIFNESQLHIIDYKNKVNSQPDLRFTLDYFDDYKFFEKIILYFGEDIIHQIDKKIINYVIRSKTFLLNAHLNEEYWNNFSSDMQKEN